MKTKAIINWFKEATFGLLDFLYPIECVHCHKVGHNFLCKYCFQKIPFINVPFCQHCGLPIENEKERYCSKCIFDFGFHDGGFSVALYDEPMSTLIQSLKYERETGIAGYLAELAFERLSLVKISFNQKCDYIHPVPLFPKRKSARGFNQSALIAKHLSFRIGVPLVENIIIRLRDTKSQTGLSIDERIANVRNAFSVKEASFVKGKSILLIDDVMTTGSTIQECARTLKSAGASRVYFITIARQMLDGSD